MRTRQVNNCKHQQHQPCILVVKPHIRITCSLALSPASLSLPSSGKRLLSCLSRCLLLGDPADGALKSRLHGAACGIAEDLQKGRNHNTVAALFRALFLGQAEMTEEELQTGLRHLEAMAGAQWGEEGLSATLANMRWDALPLVCRAWTIVLSSMYLPTRLFFCVMNSHR